MRLDELVSTVHDRFDVDAAMADVTAICAYDRYQASEGIVAAAAYVAGRAEAAGLSDVSVLSYPADGAQRWWTYRAPLSWTPLRARLIAGGVELVRYPEQPYSLAAYSTGPDGSRPVRLLRWSGVHADSDLTDAVIVVDGRTPMGVVVDRLAGTGAAGLVLDPLDGRPRRRIDQIGRLELMPGSTIAAFSVNQPALSALCRAADTAARASVEILLSDALPPMPVVTGHLPGTRDDSGEFLLTAHLCHPRPSANDNASGVSVLLGAARVLGDLPEIRAAGGMGVRFLWAPEFLGVAAYLHDEVHTGRAPRPRLALNIDMAGEDVAQCGGPLVIERGPDGLPSFLPALAQRCAALIPPSAWSYSGAVPSDPWTVRSAPFAGGSDHALLVAAPTRTPAVSLGHWPDRVNHTSADTVDTVDPAELRRTAVVATAVVAAVLGAQSDLDLATDLTDATASWAAQHVLTALPGHRPSTSARDRAAVGEVLDPHADAETGRLVHHRTGVALDAVASLALLRIDPDRIRVATDHVAAIAAAASVDTRHVPKKTAGKYTDPRVLTANYDGPANLRALAAASTDDDRRWLDGQIAQDRGGNYARALALIGSIDGCRTRAQSAWWAALASELPIPALFADRFFDLLCRAGWATSTTGGG